LRVRRARYTQAQGKLDDAQVFGVLLLSAQFTAIAQEPRGGVMPLC